MYFKLIGLFLLVVYITHHERTNFNEQEVHVELLWSQQNTHLILQTKSNILSCFSNPPGFRRFSAIYSSKTFPPNIMEFNSSALNAYTTGNMEAISYLFNDPLFSSQFYMIPTQKSPQHKPPYDINVLPVWIKDKNFGQNVKIMIIDDGINIIHPDLQNPYFEFDLVQRAQILLQFTPRSMEGTKIAGVIAMRANNGICGVGVAPLATLGRCKPMSADSRQIPTNEDFAKALLFKTKEIDIVFTSWAILYKDSALSPYIGPLLQAYEETATKGRRGKGVIHVVPVGNRGSWIYTCGSNVLLQSIYTIGVSGSEYDGSNSEYAEHCAAVMVTAYSSFGASDEYMTVVPSMNETCTKIHGATGAAAALVAGTVALALNARPDLTWREIQHAIVWTSEVSPLQHDPFVWNLNGAGFYVSEYYGFGMINAYELVKKAKSIKHISPMISCIEPVYDYTTPTTMNDTLSKAKERRSKKIREYKHEIVFCSGTHGNVDKHVNYIEHVQLRVSLEYPSKRGDITITLKSPSGTQATLLDRQPQDHSTKGMLEWYFDSVMMWGESPRGTWTIRISIHFTVQKAPEIHVQRVYLLIHGTHTAPPHYYTSFGHRRIRRYKKPIPDYLPPRPSSLKMNNSLLTIK